MRYDSPQPPIHETRLAGEVSEFSRPWPIWAKLALYGVLGFLSWGLVWAGIILAFSVTHG